MVHKSDKIPDGGTAEKSLISTGGHHLNKNRKMTLPRQHGNETNQFQSIEIHN